MEITHENYENLNDYNINNKYIHKSANKYFYEGDYINAILLYDELLKTLFNNDLVSIIYSNKSACYLMLKDYVKALQNGVYSIKNNNINSKAWGRIGWSLKKIKKNDEAFNAFKIANKLNPSNINYKNEIFFYKSKKINNINLIKLFKSSAYITNKLSNKDLKNNILKNIFTPTKLLEDNNILHIIDYIIDKIN